MLANKGGRGGFGSPLAVEGPSSLSLFTVDIIHDPEKDDLIVLDLNGSRSTYAAFRMLYGDDRVERAAIKLVGEHGCGRIHAPSLISEPPLNLGPLDSIERAGACGLNRASEAYMPLGNPQAIVGEERCRAIAADLGIEYLQWMAHWDPHSRRLMMRRDGAVEPLDDWCPNGIIWPFSWNLRRFDFAESTDVVNCLPLHLFTTNKLLLSQHFGGDDLCAPASASFNFLPERVTYDHFEDILTPGDLAVVKPVLSRRAYGLFTPRCSDIGALAREMGVAVPAEDAELGAFLFAVSALQGEGLEHLALLQRFVRGDVRLHPTSGKPHLVTIRAAGYVVGNIATMIDACEVLHQEALANSGLGRHALISAELIGGVLPLEPDLYDRVQNAVETAVESLVAKICKVGSAGAVSFEIDELLPILARRTSLNLAEIFDLARRYVGSSAPLDATVVATASVEARG